MAHPTQQGFCLAVKRMFPAHFQTGQVLDVGSYNVNGCNRPLFEPPAIYTGLDAAPGPNVDLVSLAHELDHPDGKYSVIITTSMLEHDPFWRQSLENMLRMLAPAGLLIITCAGPGYPEHGTRRTNLTASPANMCTPGWQDYYKNLDEEDLRGAIDPEFHFEKFAFAYLPATWDMFFWGLKKAGVIARS